MNPFERIDENRLRHGEGVKWGSVESDVIGAWVADMDFGIPPAVADAIAELVRSGDLGYPNWPDGNPVAAAFETRMRNRFDWTPTPGRVRVHTDLIQALQLWIEQSSEPGDGIAVHVPTYPPFLESIHRAGRVVVPIDVAEPVDRTDVADELRRRLESSGATMLVLCNPQNPTGHCFTRPELVALASVADDLGLTVVCDEVHADLVYAPHVHVPFASVGAGALRRTITVTSATKSYNLAAIRLAVSHVGPDRIWERIEAAPPDLYGVPSTLATAATIAAWARSDDWLAGLRSVLADNRDTVARWTSDRDRIHGYRSPDASYLAWLDVSGANLGPRPAAEIERRARVKLSEGEDFSAHTSVDTERFVRLNFATSPANLDTILRRLDGLVGTGG